MESEDKGVWNGGVSIPASFSSAESRLFYKVSVSSSLPHVPRSLNSGHNINYHNKATLHNLIESRSSASRVHFQKYEHPRSGK